jgi:hypothetical protein
MLSGEQIETHIRFIGEALEAMANDDQALGACVEIGERFEDLRAQYRDAPDSLAAHVQRLSALRNRFHALLANRVSRVVDHYFEVGERIRQAEREKAFWRGVLIQQATQAARQHLTGVSATVRVQPKEQRVVPAAGTDHRAKLEESIRSSGRWDQVSHLSRARLERALDQGVFDEAQAKIIADFCPVALTHMVSVRAIER